MNNRLTTPELQKLSIIQEGAIAYWLSLWDDTTGGFRFTSYQPATLMATAYSVLGLEFTRGLSRLRDSQKEAVIFFLMAGVQPDGSFRDPLFRSEDILTEEHDLSYFQEETTTMCQQALDALLAPPPPPRDFPGSWRSADGLIDYFESFSWKNPWLDSNRVMFALSQLCHDSDRHQQPKLLELVDAALDWLDTHQSSETGLWQGNHEVDLTNAMAATFHFTFYYGYRDRPLKYVKQIIDSVLSLQEPHGLFSNYSIGQTCLDYDALDLLAKASLATDYRSEDLEKAMMRAYRTLLTLHNSADGGFANCKEYAVDPSWSLKGRLLMKLGLSRFMPLFFRVPAQGEYHVCWRLLTCEMPQSNAFSTWFRLLGLFLATQKQWLDTDSNEAFTFRRLPFLGYHNPLSVSFGTERNTTKIVL